MKSSQKCLDKAHHEELLDLCESIIETQEDEVELLEDWLCDWYGVCD